MIGLPPRNGRRYWLTSVPQTPATSTLNRAASSDISGSSNSRNSIVDGPTFIAASVVSVTTITSCRLHDALVYVPHKRRATRALPWGTAEILSTASSRYPAPDPPRAGRSSCGVDQRVGGTTVSPGEDFFRGLRPRTPPQSRDTCWRRGLGRQPQK